MYLTDRQKDCNRSNSMALILIISHKEWFWLSKASVRVIRQRIGSSIKTLISRRIKKRINQCQPLLLNRSSSLEGLISENPFLGSESEDACLRMPSFCSLNLRRKWSSRISSRKKDLSLKRWGALFINHRYGQSCYSPILSQMWETSPIFQDPLFFPCLALLSPFTGKRIGVYAKLFLFDSESKYFIFWETQTSTEISQLG